MAVMVDRGCVTTPGSRAIPGLKRPAAAPIEPLRVRRTDGFHKWDGTRAGAERGEDRFGAESAWQRRKGSEETAAHGRLPQSDVS